jgi:hypothetical protein
VRDRCCGAQARGRGGYGRRSGCTGQKKLIERAYAQGESSGIAVWTEDKAGPYQTVPYSGASWQPAGEPRRMPHASRIRTSGNGQALDSVSSGHRRGSGARGEADDQRDTPSLAQGGTSGHRREFAGEGDGTRPRGEPLRVEELAGGAVGEDPPARRTAAFADACGLGQPHRPPQRRAPVVDVLEGGHGALHAAWGQLAEHERIHPAHPCRTGTLRRASTLSRADHRVAGGSGSWVESGPNTV